MNFGLSDEVTTVLPENRGPFPDSRVDPLPIDAIHGIPVGKVAWDHAPLTPGSDHVQHGIQDQPAVDAFPATSSGPGDQVVNQLPLLTREIAGMLSLQHGCGSFLGLPRLYTKEP